nr:MAG TPA: hypothetical protein [Bacteriophage sp.]
MLIIGQRKTLLRVEFADSKVVVPCLRRVGSTPTATIPWLKRKPHMFSENQAYEVEKKTRL